MSKLRLTPVLDEKPVKMTVEFPASLHRALTLYAHALSKEAGGATIDSSKLVAPMIERFIRGDKAFRKIQNERSARPASIIGKAPLSFAPD
jgi:hypothetical protein